MSRDPKLSGYTKKRFIHFDLMKERDTKKIKRDERHP